MTTAEKKLVASKIAQEFVSRLERNGTVTKDTEGLRRVISKKLLAMGAVDSKRA